MLMPMIEGRDEDPIERFRKITHPSRNKHSPCLAHYKCDLSYLMLLLSFSTSLVSIDAVIFMRSTPS